MEEQVEWICSISEHTELVQGRVINDTLKNLKKYFWKGGIKFFFEKNFFRPKNFKKLSFLVIFWQKFSKVTEHTELVQGRVINDTLKNLKKYFWKGGIKFFFEKNFFRPKNFKKLSFLVIFWQKFSKVTEPEELSSHRVVYGSGKWPY